MDQVAIRSAKEPIDEDHYSILSEMIATVSEDHTQLRMLVYEFARRKSRRSIYRQFEDGDWADIQEQLRALETAIGKVEFDCAHKSLTFAPEPPLTYGEVSDGPSGGWPLPRRAVTVSGPSGPIFQQPIASDGDVFVAVARIGQRARANLWWTVQLCLAVLLGAVVFAAMGGRSTLGLWGQAGKKRRPERVRPNQMAGMIFTFPRQSGGLPKLCEQAFPFLPSMALSRSPKDG